MSPAKRTAAPRTALSLSTLLFLSCLGCQDKAPTGGGDAPQKAPIEVTTIHPQDATPANHDVWLSDGETVRTYRAGHRFGTDRPSRSRVAGLDGRDLPGTSRAYHPRTNLPANSLVETFVHPAGFCQNVLATGRSWISGTVDVVGREAVVLECDHPRSIGIAADRPDHHLQVSFDRETGVIVRLVEVIAGDVTRAAHVTSLLPDAALSPAVFAFSFPSGATLIY